MPPQPTKHLHGHMVMICYSSDLVIWLIWWSVDLVDLVDLGLVDLVDLVDLLNKPGV